MTLRSPSPNELADFPSYWGAANCAGRVGNSSCFKMAPTPSGAVTAKPWQVASSSGGPKYHGVPRVRGVDTQAVHGAVLHNRSLAYAGQVSVARLVESP